jgi:hypothetical protein
VQTQESPLRQYLLSVSSAGKMTLTPIAIGSVLQEASSSSSCQMISSQITSFHKQQQGWSPSLSTTAPSTTATSPIPITEMLLSTPVSFIEPFSFRPHDILPLPQVAQSGPRIPKQNKRLGATWCLTSSPDMKRTRKQNDQKQREGKEAENRKTNSVEKKSNQNKLKEVKAKFTNYFSL